MLKNKINENKSKYIEDVRAYVSQPSVAADNNGMEEMCTIIEQRLNSLGADVQKVSVKDSYPFLLAELKAKTDSENKPTVLIYNHYDVQPAEPLDLWNSEPFSLEERDGLLIGRGVADNKGNLVQRIQGVEILLEENDDLPVNIKWLIEGEEEIGSPHLHDLQEEYGDFWKEADVCVWETGGVNADGAPVMKLGMKGVLYIELESVLNDGDLHSGNATISDSAVWRLIHALNTLRSSEGDVLIDGFYENALQPTDAEIELMQNNEFEPRKLVENVGLKKTLVDPENKLEFQKQLYFKATANVCGIWGGYTEPGKLKTILPNKATAKMDLRLIPNQKSGEILSKIRAHLENRGFDDIVVRELISEEAGKSNIENENIQKCLSVMRDVYGKEPEIHITNLGSGPIHYIAGVYDIPVVQIGAGYPATKAHAPNENVRTADYFKSLEAFCAYINSF